MKLRKLRIGFLAAMAFTAFAVMFVGMSVNVSAQGGQPEVTAQTATPLPSPTNNGGKSTWQIKANGFTSSYPKGFEFSLDVASSAGKVTDATLEWSYAPGYINRSAGKIDVTTTPIHYFYSTEGTNHVPQWVGVEYWWDLKDSAGNVFQTPHYHSEYEDTRHKWTRYESDDIIVFLQDGVPLGIGQMTMDAMKQQRLFYYQNWGKLLNFKPRAIVYADKATLEEVEPGMTIFAAGTTQINWGATIQIYENVFFDSAPGRYTSYEVIPHEVGHLYQALAGGNAQGVDWFIEGDATYFQIPTRDGHDCVSESRNMAASGTLQTLQGEGPSIRGRPSEAVGYDIGCAFFHWLAEKYGPDAHRKLWEMLAENTPRADALKKITGLDAANMDTAFRTWLGMSSPVAATPIELTMPDFPATPTPTN